MEGKIFYGMISGGDGTRMSDCHRKFNPVNNVCRVEEQKGIQ